MRYWDDTDSYQQTMCTTQTVAMRYGKTDSNRQHEILWMTQTATMIQVLCKTLVMSTIPKRKQKRSDIEANYRNETKTF